MLIDRQGMRQIFTSAHCSVNEKAIAAACLNVSKVT